MSDSCGNNKEVHYEEYDWSVRNCTHCSGYIAVGLRIPPCDIGMEVVIEHWDVIPQEVKDKVPDSLIQPVVGRVFQKITQKEVTK